MAVSHVMYRKVRNKAWMVFFRFFFDTEYLQALKVSCNASCGEGSSRKKGKGGILASAQTISIQA